MNYKEFGRKQFYPSIFLERMKKNMKNASQSGQFPGCTLDI
jgi:hypothetical protein